MKKALAILLVVAVAFGAFADDPAANFSLNTFTGNAKLEWVQDLETGAYGFNNDQKVELFWNMITAGSKATTGDGVWGELVIQNKDISRVAGFELIGGDKGNQYSEWTTKYWASTAKIHFVDGDFGVSLDLLSPDLDLGQGSVATAINISRDAEDWIKSGRIFNPQTDVNGNPQNEIGKDGEGNPIYAPLHGFGLNITSNLVDAFFKVKDNGVIFKDQYGNEYTKKQDKKWAFSAGTTIKPVTDLAISAAFAYANDETPIRVGANYKVNLNDEGSLYLKPAVDFTLNGDAKDLLVGSFFGWGAEGQEHYLYYINEQTWDWWQNTLSDGLSVAYQSNLDGASNLYVSLFDSTLLDGFTFGAVYFADVKEIGKGALEAAARYATDIDIITLEFNVGFDGVLGNKAASTYKYGAKISTDDVVENTTLFVDYTGSKAIKKGWLRIGANIAF